MSVPYLEKRKERLEPDQGPIHRALVLGATGLIGGAVARELCRRKIPVRALRRWKSRPEVLGPCAEDIDWIVGDLGDVASLEEAMVGCDVVVHAAAYYPTVSVRAREIVHTACRGMRNVLQVAHASGLKRLVYVSSPSTVQGSSGVDQMGNEADLYTPGSVDDPYYQAKYWMELDARRAAGQGVPAVVVNPTICLGPGDPKPTSGRLILTYARGGFPAAPAGTINVVDVRDAASSILAACIHGEPGQRYILGGHNLAVTELAEKVRTLVGKPSSVRAIPSGLLVAASRASERLAAHVTRRPPLLPLHGVHMMVHGGPLSSARAEQALGHTARPLEETLRDTLDDFRSRGWL